MTPSTQPAAVQAQPAAVPVSSEHLISLDRQSRLIAGSMSLLGVALGFFVHPGFYALGLVVGVGLLFAGLTDICGMSLLLAKMPWNRTHAGTAVGGPR